MIPEFNQADLQRWREIKSMTIKGYRIWISRNGEEFEVEGDKAFVLKMLERFESNGATKSQSNGSAIVRKRREKLDLESLPIKGKSVSIREFVQQLGLKKHTDIT